MRNLNNYCLSGDNMLDFEKIAEISFFVVELEQMLVLDNGIVITKDNVGQFLNSNFDA